MQTITPYVAARAKRTRNGWMGYAHHRDANGGWYEYSQITRLNERDALDDANNLVYQIEGQTLHCDRVEWRYA